MNIVSPKVAQPPSSPGSSQFSPRLLAKVSHAGLDGHRTFSRMTVRDADNRILFRCRLEHADRAALRQSLRELPAATPVILEGSFGWGWLADELTACGLAPHLANGRKVEGWRKARGMAKTNQLDADLLSELWRQQPRWWEVWLAPQEVRDQREWLRYRMGLVRQQTMTKNRIHATLHRQGILNPYSDLFGQAGRAFLQALLQDAEHLRPSTRQTLAGHLTLLTQLRRQIAQVTRTLRRQIRHDPAAQLWDSLPGVGALLAYTIQAEIGDIRRFARSQKLARYALLAPQACDSGEETGETPQGRHVGHLGRLTLKWAFIAAAHGAIKKSPHFREMWERYTQGGTGARNRGYIAVARHLCHVGMACVKKKTPYRENAPPRPGTPGTSASAPAPGSKPGSVTAVTPQQQRTVGNDRSEDRPESGQPDHPMARSAVRRPSQDATAGVEACL